MILVANCSFRSFGRCKSTVFRPQVCYSVNQLEVEEGSEEELRLQTWLKCDMGAIGTSGKSQGCCGVQEVFILAKQQ